MNAKKYTKKIINPGGFSTPIFLPTHLCRLTNVFWVYYTNEVYEANFIFALTSFNQKKREKR